MEKDHENRRERWKKNRNNGKIPLEIAENM
jgi:hypothetical protein